MRLNLTKKKYFDMQWRLGKIIFGPDIHLLDALFLQGLSSQAPQSAALAPSDGTWGSTSAGVSTDSPWLEWLETEVQARKSMPSNCQGRRIPVSNFID